MKKDIIDISEMSDSKEIYAERPNPFTALFIYSLVALLVIAIIYCCFGTIEVTATANGIIRPNDDVSSISSMSRMLQKKGFRKHKVTSLEQKYRQYINS